MDKTLERILSLIPHKPDGKFVHGAVKKFATELGLKSGNIISDWISGRSKSYEGYLYQISALHNVSVEWLRGETDDPSPAEKKEKPTARGGGPMYPEWYGKLTPEETEQVRKYAEFLISERRKDQP